MAQPPSEVPRAAAAWKPLDARQRRVLGVLIEKAKTTPAAYPMTVNAIVTGCNQKNNRDPLTAYDEEDVEQALRDLGALHVVSEIDWLGRVAKYKHDAYAWLGVDRHEMAVLAELLLRGAQALGELRGRAARMEAIADLAALKPIVTGLVGRGLMIELTGPGRGQIVSHGLYPAHELAEVKARFHGHVPREPGEDAANRSHVPTPNPATSPSATPTILHDARGGAGDGTLAALSAEVAVLRAEVASLRERVGDLEAKLTAALG